jgi:hypothetical protein
MQLGQLEKEKHSTKLPVLGKIGANCNYTKPYLQLPYEDFMHTHPLGCICS